MGDSRKKFRRAAPKTVRVGCFDLKVKFAHIDSVDALGVMGFVMPDRQVIYLRANSPRQQTANTFIHEVMHAIHYVYGVDNDSSEEEFTTQGANGLCAFWRDNPEAMLWWQDLLKKPAAKKPKVFAPPQDQPQDEDEDEPTIGFILPTRVKTPAPAKPKK